MTAKENAKLVADGSFQPYQGNTVLSVFSQRELAQAYLSLLERNEKLEAVAEAAKYICKSWNQNREEIYRRLDIYGSIISIDPAYRHLDKLGLVEALKLLEGNDGDVKG